MAPRVLVFGTGSVAGVYTYILCQAIGQENVVAVCRSNYDAALKNGFIIDSVKFGNNLNIKPHIVRTVSEAIKSKLCPFSHVVIGAKALPSTPPIPSQIAPAITPDTSIILIQNGIGIESIYAAAFPDSPIISCVAYLPATQTAPAVIAHKDREERLHIGAHTATGPDSHRQAAKQFYDMIQTGGGTAFFHEDIQQERWSKLLVNASWNPITALCRSRDAQFLASSPDAKRHLRGIMLEIASIAQAAGYPSITEETVDWQISRASARSLPGVETSMLADARAGRQMEVEAIVGNALRIAEDKGVKTPLLRGLYVLANALNESFRRAD